MSTNKHQFYLERGGSMLLMNNALAVRTESTFPLILLVPDLRTRLDMIRWFGRLFEIMHARLHDKPVRPALVGQRDIPDVVVSLGTAWTRLHWPGGNAVVTIADVEKALALLGVDGPVYRWTHHCRHRAGRAGMKLEPAFFE